MQPETTTFLECAARIEAMVKPGMARTVTVQDMAELLQELAHQQIALMRFLHSEFPDAKKIREAVFTGRGRGNCGGFDG